MFIARFNTRGERTVFGLYYVRFLNGMKWVSKERANFIFLSITRQIFLTTIMSFVFRMT